MEHVATLCKANKSTYWVLFELFHGMAFYSTVAKEAHLALLVRVHLLWQRVSLGCGATSSASLPQSTAT